LAFSTKEQISASYLCAEKNTAHLTAYNEQVNKCTICAPHVRRLEFISLPKLWLENYAFLFVFIILTITYH